MRALGVMFGLCVAAWPALAPAQAYRLRAEAAEIESFKGDAEIGGRLTWSGGAPAANTRFDVVAQPPGAEAVKIAEATTDADGRYAIAGLAAKKARYRLYLASDETQRTFYIFAPKPGAKVRYDYEFQPRVGDPAPAHVMPGLDGKPVNLADYRGKVVVLKFWAVWCGPCHAEMAKAAELLRARKDWAGRAEFLAVNCDPDRATLDAFIAEKRLDGMVHLHEPGKKLEGARSRGFHVDSLPSTFVIDAKGIVRSRGDSPEKMESLVDALLKKDGPP